MGGGFAKISFQLRNYIRPVITKSVHAFLGMVTYVLGMVTFGYGLYSNWFTNNNSGAVQNTFLGFIVLSSIYVLYQPIINFIHRVEAAMQKD